MAERQPAIFIATGQTGVGKTYTTAREVERYVRRGRKVLIFDVNQEDEWTKYRALDFDVEQEDEDRAAYAIKLFNKQKRAEAVRIVPLTKKRKGMDLDQLARTCEILMRYFKHGLLVVEDINRYVTNTRSKKFVSSLCTNRHRRQDIMIHLQSLQPVDMRLWNNVSFIRFHRQVDDVSKCKYKVPNYPLMKVAQLIVNAEHLSGNARYYLWIDIRGDKIMGVTQAQFAKAAEKYLAHYAGELTPFLNMENEHGQKLFPNRRAAVQGWIAENQKMVG